uniref:Uncharacterized protein n=1 Tax=Arundo donax TaxID=35708 RepID=A0A0A9ETD6_ARUDO
MSACYQFFTCRKGLHFGRVQCWNLSLCKNLYLGCSLHVCIAAVGYLLIIVKKYTVQGFFEDKRSPGLF